MKVSWTFDINGTDENPFAKWGFTQNPFPQHGQFELNAADLAVQSLGGEPVKSGDDIRERLKGVFNETFISEVVSHYVPGQMVRCTVTCEW